jgi:hypothetical protein
MEITLALAGCLRKLHVETWFLLAVFFSSPPVEITLALAGCLPFPASISFPVFFSNFQTKLNFIFINTNSFVYNIFFCLQP